jgi:hypothetical protein
VADGLPLPQSAKIVGVRDPKTIEVLELRVGYVKDRFGKLCRQDIKRPDVLAFMRPYEAEGKLGLNLRFVRAEVR